MLPQLIILDAWGVRCCLSVRHTVNGESAFGAGLDESRDLLPGEFVQKLTLTEGSLPSWFI